MRKITFTLIELLVVVAIIAILIAMLLPALSAVRWKAQIIVCQNQQKQVHLAMLQKVNDSNNKFPSHGEGSASYGHMFWLWPAAYTDDLWDKYLGDTRVALCPTDQSATRSELEPASWIRTTGYAWTCNPRLASEADKNDRFGNILRMRTGVNDYEVRRAADDSSKILLMDPLYHTIERDVGNYWAWRWKIPPSRRIDGGGRGGLHSRYSNRVDGRSAEGGNQTWLDGSCRWVPFREMEMRMNCDQTYTGREWYW